VAKSFTAWREEKKAERKSRGELFLADWLSKNKAGDAEVREVIRLCEEYRSPGREDRGLDHFDYIEAIDDIMRVMREGIDEYSGNRLFDMLSYADLKRVRQCLSCNRWLFALDPRQRHCTPKCRDSFRMNTAKYRERKKEHMRRLRRIDKERRARQSALHESGSPKRG